MRTVQGFGASEQQKCGQYNTLGRLISKNADSTILWGLCTFFWGLKKTYVFLKNVFQFPRDLMVSVASSGQGICWLQRITRSHGNVPTTPETTREPYQERNRNKRGASTATRGNQRGTTATAARPGAQADTSDGQAPGPHGALPAEIVAYPEGRENSHPRHVPA